MKILRQTAKRGERDQYATKTPEALRTTSVATYSQTMSGNSPPPGWYSDGQGRQRWWDGHAWFESVDARAGASSQDTHVLDVGSESLEESHRMSPAGRRNKGGSRLAGLLAKSPLALMILGGIVVVVGIIALLVVDPTCLNNEECGALSETFWALFSRGIILVSGGLLLATVGIVWYRRNRRALVLEADSAGSASMHSSSASAKSWYRRWWGLALLALPIVTVAAIAVGLALNSDDDSGSALPQATYPPTAEPFQAEDLTAEEEAALAAEEEAEAEAEAKSDAELRDPKTYKSISHRKWAQVAKDPDSYVGKKYVLYGYVTQFDSATGNDSFLVSTDAKPRTYYDYDINTIATTEKPKRFRKVVEDDLVKMWVQVGGAISYDTQVGGNTTVPSVVVNIIKVTGSGG